MSKLREIRQMKNITLDQISASSGIDRGHISRIEHGLVPLAFASARRLIKGYKARGVDVMGVVETMLNVRVREELEKKCS